MPDVSSGRGEHTHSTRQVAEVRTNIPQLQASWDAFDKALVKAIPDMLKDCVKYQVEELVKYTPPIKDNQLGAPKGGTADARKQGEKNIARDIDMLFKPLEYQSFGDLVMARNTDAVWAYENMIFENKRLQKAWDTKNFEQLYHAFESNGWEYTEEDFGYIDALTMPIVEGMWKDYGSSGAIRDAVKNNKSARFLVKNAKSIDAVKKARQLHVGKMVGGWVKVLKQLGGVVTENFNNNGTGIIKTSGLGTPNAKMVADNPYADYNNMMSQMGILQRIEAEAELRLKMAMEKKIDEIIKKTAPISHSGANKPPPLPGGPPPLPKP